MVQPLPDLQGDSLVDIVAADIPHLNKTFRRIADYLVAAPEDFMQKPVQEIAAAVSVSEPSIVRFCRRYGMKGIPDFRIQLAMSLARSNVATFPRRSPSRAPRACWPKNSARSSSIPARPPSFSPNACATRRPWSS